MENFFHHLLACLCIADIGFLICNLLVAPLAFGIHTPVITFMFPIAECGSHLMLSISVFLTVCITIERYQVVICVLFSAINSFL